MAISSTQRALIAVALMLVVLAGAIALYIHRMRRPFADTSGSETSGGTTPSLLAELPSDAPAIAYADVAALRKVPDSPLSALLGLTTNGSQADKDYAKFVGETGFDYTRDLDQAAIAFWPSGLDPATNAAGDNPALAIADGRFDQAKIDAYAVHASGRLERRGAESIYVVPGRPTVAFTFLSNTRIAIASGNNAAKLLDGPLAGRTDPAVQTRVQLIAGAPIFGVARTSSLPASIYADFANSPQLEHLVRGIQELSLAGKPEKDVIHVTLDAQCDSMKNALEISTLLDGFRLVGSVALSDPKTRGQLGVSREQAAFLADVVKQAQVSHQDRRIRISLDVTPQMLDSGAK